MSHQQHHQSQQQQHSAEVASGKLLERLQVSEEWNVRLQNQIQDLLRLPRNEVEAMRERMQSPEIAIPLLQCYDAAIQGRAEECESLRRENTRLAAAVALRAGEHADLSAAVKVAEDLARHVQGTASEATQRATAALREAQAELSQLRQELARAMDAEAEGRRAAERLTADGVALRADLAAALTEKARLESALSSAAEARRRLECAEGETLAGREAQRVKAAVLSAEGAEQLAELERLRQRMVTALRSASDGHAAHMAVVEERHALVVEQVRSVNRTQELELAKMRAQLARVDPSSSSCGGSWLSSPGGGGGGGHGLTSTTQLLEAQTRQAQEAEIRRLHNALAAAAAQRDEALVRCERLAGAARRAAGQQSLDARAATAALEATCEGQRRRLEELEAVAASARREADGLRCVQSQLETALEASRATTEAAGAEATEARRRQSATAQRLAEAEAALQAVESAGAQRSAALEARVAAAVADVREATSRSAAECVRAVEERDEARRHQRAAAEQLTAVQRAAEEARRAAHVAETQCGRLSQGLEMHKRQSAACDERILALQGQLDVAVQRSKMVALTVERLRLENDRLVRSRERALAGPVF